MERFARSYMLLGREAMEKLQNAHVLLFGLGGVGGMAAEALARAGVGALTIVDNDAVSLSNLNRQILATEETLGLSKVEVAKRRIALINPRCRVTMHELFYLPENEDIITGAFDYVVDAIDTVTAKIDIIMKAKSLGIPVISCMGTGNKLHPELLEIEDIFKTSVCPLCRVMRTELKKRGCKGLTVVYSKEKPHKTDVSFLQEGESERTPGSISFVPPAAGLLMASKVVQDLAQL
ncbi:MAG: tRNA threonylcarbamoyladenosine dehydratase [Ruminococcaceae bacterium]|nr:tRNA threonylcarbamoyladenosine dehydratase [Oscillospiraceae bacterium]